MGHLSGWTRGVTEHKCAFTLQHREGGWTHGGCTLVDLSMLFQVCKPHMEILNSHPPAPGDYRVFFPAVESCTTRSRCNIDANGKVSSIFSVSDSVFGGRAV